MEEALDLSFDRLLMMMMKNGMNIKAMVEYAGSVMPHWYLLIVNVTDTSRC